MSNYRHGKPVRPTMNEYVSQFDEMEQRVSDLEAAHVWLTAYIVSLEQDLNEFMEALWMENPEPEDEAEEPRPEHALSHPDADVDVVNVAVQEDGTVRVADRPASMSESWARNPAAEVQYPAPPVDTAESVQADKDPVDAFVEVNEEPKDVLGGGHYAD